MTWFGFSGTITKRGPSKIKDIEVILTIRPSKPDLQIKVTDIQFQGGEHVTLRNDAPTEMFHDLNEDKFYNSIARGDKVVIVPYHSEIPFDTAGEVTCLESGYRTTPLKIRQNHYPYVDIRQVKITQGLSMIENTTNAKGYWNDAEMGPDDELIVDGEVSKSYLNGEEGYYHFGQFLRVPNADAKFKIHTPEARTRTWALLSYNSTMLGKE